jgi:hypothetical protein
MRFMCLIYIEPDRMVGMTPADFEKLDNDTIEEDIAIKAAGKLVLATPLQEPKTAITLRQRNGVTRTTDGPFAETKEHLGGVVIIEAKDMEEAIALSRDAAILRIAAMEIRPLPETADVHSKTGESRPVM